MIQSRPSYEALLQIAENAPEVIARFDLQYRHLYINPYGAKVYGRSCEEILGKTNLELGMPVEHMDHTIKIFAEVFARREPLTAEFEFDSPCFGHQHFSTLLVPEFDERGEALSVLAITRDITELKHSQLALEQSERKFCMLFDHSPVAMALLSYPEGKLVNVNEAWESAHGYSRQQVIGRTSAELGFYADPSERERIFEEIGRRGRLRGVEVVSRDRDGRFHSLSVDVSLIELEGRPHILSTFFDNTERKRAEEALKASMRAADAANRAKSEFLANMSHEIRSPMNSVLGYADLLMEPDLDHRELRDYAARIKASGEHLLHVIDEILDLSKVEAGQIQIERRRFDVTELVDDCLRSFAVLAERKGLQLAVDFATPVPREIESDPIRFKQILMNLLSNAVKFTDKGKVEVVLRYARAAGSGARTTPAGRLSVDVIDTGIGIPPHKQDILFLPFSQADASITRRYGGTGLGLHLSRRLIRSLGGELMLKWSECGRGSCFSFVIETDERIDERFVRAIEVCCEKPAPQSPAPPANIAQLHVLLVEDSIDNQQLMKIYLGKLQVRVDIAENGVEAIEQALGGTHDLVLMDIMMPVMDGLEATRRLRALGYRKPIIALTAHAMKEEVARFIEAGCDAHLPKPVDRSELVAAIAKLSLKSGTSSNKMLAHERIADL